MEGKKISRRKFFTLTGAAAAAFGLGGRALAEIFDGEGSHSDKSVRWGMVIDLREFDSNPALIDRAINACHSIHNVPDVPESRHAVRWIWAEVFEHAFIEQENHRLPESIRKKPVLLLCNHCDHPPCVGVCPTKATWRRDEDGLVMMDWHRCIGCRYCMAACPYGSRSFNFSGPREHIKDINDYYPTRTKGVVEKCTFCDELLSRQIFEGKNPQTACAKAMEDSGSKAIVFGNLNDRNSEVAQILRNHYAIRRKPELGTQPEVYYIVGGV